MKQRKTWTNYSIIGIKLISILILFYSCSESEEYILKTTFSYKNLTSEKVEIDVIKNGKLIKYTILKNEKINILSKISGSKTGVGEPFEGASKITIRFVESNLCLTNFPKLKDSREYDNFSKNMYETSDNILIYKIDEEEYNKAIKCI